AENSLPDNLYYWRVAAKDNAGNKSNFSSFRSFRVDTVKPAIPSLTSPAHGAWVITPSLKWNSVTDISLPVLYNLQIAYDNDFLHLVVNVELLENSWSGQLDEGPYWWRVQAKDGASNPSGWSENRKFIVDNTPPTKPVLSTPENNTDVNAGTITFGWQASDLGAGISKYWIQIDNEPDFDNTYLVHENQVVTENTYQYTISVSGRYYWRVKATDGAGNVGEWSDGYNFFVYGWTSIESWTATINSPSWWRNAESWNATIKTRAYVWEKLENWSATIQAPFLAGWTFMESWQVELISITTLWKGVETWKVMITGRVIAPVLLSPPNGLNTSQNPFTFRWENVHLVDNYRIQIDNKGPVIVYENDNVGAEPETLVDGSLRRGEILGG
ncbi:MAG: SusE domain-containing protein, partial [Candidatus Hadarchaeales archaeon]